MKNKAMSDTISTILNKAMSDTISTILIVVLVLLACGIVGAIVINSVNNSVNNSDAQLYCERFGMMKVKNQMRCYTRDENGVFIIKDLRYIDKNIGFAP